VGFFDRLRKIAAHEISDSGDNSDGESISNSQTDYEAISSLTSACTKLENTLGLKSTGRCSVCVKDVSTESFEEMKQYVKNFLGIASNKEQQATSGLDISFGTVIDDYGYLWFVLEGRTLEDILVALNAVGDTIHEKGFSRQLLAAVFEFTDGYGDTNNNYQYLIYNYKLDRFYPFVPRMPAEAITATSMGGAESNKKRNHQQELRIMEEIADEIPFEKDLSLWHPIWNIPMKQK
jgi:hypothetical protein